MSRRIESPTPAQRAAANPGVSAWVGANAGSGKTRVLTHRVARLLLEGVPPEKILCLTYTRAAAAEMQNRLFDLLGRWAMDEDATLGRELANLGGDAAPVTDPAILARARRLFAQALETPGGLRIQTIHAFCDSLLRRFPLEAGVSPGFEMIDDRQQAAMIEAIREEMALAAAKGTDPAFDGLAERLADATLDSTIGALTAARTEFPDDDPEPLLAAHFGPATEGEEAVAKAALAQVDWHVLAAHAALLERAGGASDRKAAASVRDAMTLRDGAAAEAAAVLAGGFLTQDGQPRKRSGFPLKAVLAEAPEADALTDELIAWAAATRGALNAVETASRTRDLHRFARSLLRAYEAAKSARALLDFTDLIERVRTLFAGAGMAAWVLYKLDLGIDHVLVDEAQDTSPAQWEVIDAIVSEFQSGEGARDLRRTLFVVGDEKQSIYSFQGARPAEFSRMRERNAGRLEALGERLATPDLTTSFRSAPAILRFVDALFEGEAAAGLTSDGEPPEHVAHRADAVGRVDLWPLIEPPERDEAQPWDTPVDTPAPSGARQQLARRIAEEVTRLVGGERLPGPAGRPVRPGDILILVARRDALARGILRSLKALSVPVAGADRMRLTGELPVMDLMALIRVVLTPGDDLSLAALLRSPLCGLSEDELFTLAHGRKGMSLWHRLMAAGKRFDRPVAFLGDMAAKADYLRPYDFLERALIDHDGRRNLLARLGQEAEDPLDELLAQALDYESREAPTLTGFLDWLDAGDTQIRREMDAARDEVRLMTVHGAKGLEAPVVILPDTMATQSRSLTFLRLEGGNAGALTVWPGPKTADDPATAAARSEAERVNEEERRRILYVAATRAEDWLILCGAGKPSAAKKGWYGLMQSAMERLGAATHGDILRLEDRSQGEGGAEGQPAAVAPSPPRPEWLSPAPAERAPDRDAPSRLTAGRAEGGAGLGREQARLRGSAVHLILERLAHDGPLDESLAHRLIDEAFPALDAELRGNAIAEAAKVLAQPFAAAIFGPGSIAEAAIALDPARNGTPRMIGRIDRLVVTPGRVLVIDYKTDAKPPAVPEATDPSYLAQLAHYVSGAEAIFPDAAVTGAFLWTAVPVLMEVPAALLRTKRGA